jgi:hypothetical protein
LLNAWLQNLISYFFLKLTNTLNSTFILGHALQNHILFLKLTVQFCRSEIISNTSSLVASTGELVLETFTAVSLTKRTSFYTYTLYQIWIVKKYKKKNNKDISNFVLATNDVGMNQRFMYYNYVRNANIVYLYLFIYCIFWCDFCN